MTTWTEQQLEWFKSNYPKLGKQFCMKKLNKTEAQIRQRAYRLGLKQDRTSAFFREWQKKAAKSKIGKKRPDQAERLRKWIKEGVVVPHDSTTHGYSKHPAYNVWRNFLYRCYDENSSSYKHYGGRGIKVCDDWHNISKFVEWYDGNPQPDNTTIDRIDVNGNYEPDNCRWATPKIQARNKRNNTLTPDLVEKIRELVGEIGNQREVGRMLGVSYKNINQVMRGRTWAAEDE